MLGGEVSPTKNQKTPFISVSERGLFLRGEFIKWKTNLWRTKITSHAEWMDAEECLQPGQDSSLAGPSGNHLIEF